MATNLFNKEHKAASNAYRRGYDRIKWDTSDETEKHPNKDDKKE
jgi:hypothetical protein